MRIKKLLLAFVLVIGVSAAPQTAIAQSTDGEQVDSFDSAITISKDNVATITETIVYNFGAQERHGIYRVIPVDYKDGDKIYKVAFDHVSTKDADEKNIHTEISNKDGNKVLKIGDANKTISGRHTYVITYKLWPIITKVDGKPRLLLDINGNGWEVPTQRVSAVIQLDKGTSLRNIGCTTGTQGSVTTNCAIRETFPEQMTASNLQAYEGLTITADMPEGYITGGYLEAGDRRPLTKDDIIQYGIFGAIGSVIMAGIGLYAVRWSRARRRRKNQTIVPEYDPPAAMTPAEVGYLQDDVSDMREITATFIHLAVRGYISITQTSQKSLLKKADYTLQKRKDFSDAEDFEQTLLQEVFSKGDTIALSDLDASGMASAVTQVRTKLSAKLAEKGFYNQSKNEPGLLQKVLDGGTISDAGAAQWAKVEGFKLYLNTAEKDRLNFTDAPERTPERFSALLPYAVALGVEKEWAKQFEGIDVSAATNGWYNGATPYFAAAAFSADISDNFANAVSSNATVSTSSTGSSSSGGGFGGGGGGSW